MLERKRRGDHGRDDGVHFRLTTELQKPMRFLLARCVAFLLVLPAACFVWAQNGTQIVRDGSIGPDRSVQPTQSPTSEGGFSYSIDEGLGARSSDGATLFHSFETFNVGHGDTAVFTTVLPTRTVIARVTGGVGSEIFGTLGASGPPLSSRDLFHPAPAPEFFLLNPAGILLGPTSRLDGVAFSFVGSTASRLTFADGSTFQADTNASPPLLAVGEVAELSFRSAGTVRAEGSQFDATVVALIAGRTGTRVEVRRSAGIIGGAVPFSLIGISLLEAGDPTTAGGSLHVSGVANLTGRIALSLFSDGTIDLLESSLISEFGSGLIANATGPVRIRNSSVGEATLRGLDFVGVRGATIEVNGSTFFADQMLSLNADGPIQVLNSQLMSPTGGLISLNSGVSLLLDNTALRIGSDVGTRGLPVPLVMDPALDGGFELIAPVVAINESLLAVNNNTILGTRGEIRILGDRIRISGRSELSSRSMPSSLPRVGSPERELLDLLGLGGPAEGPQAGAISILAGEIEIVEGSTLSASTLGDLSLNVLQPDLFEDIVRGAAGDIRIGATRSLRVLDSQLDTRIDALFSEPSGSIHLSAADVQIERSIVSSEALSGNGGSVRIEGSGALTLLGSRLTSSGSGTANAGSVFVSGGLVTLESASILSSSNGSGRASTVHVDASNLELSASSIGTDAKQGPAPGQPADGSITIDVRGRTLLENRSIINASVQEGQGGDIEILSPQGLVLRNGSQILAQTKQGNGGRIDITSAAFLSDSGSVVSADASVGVSGTVEIRSPDVDLQGSIKDLPAEFLSASALLRPSCEAREVGGGTASLYIARAVGLPASPDEWLLAYDTSPRPVDATSEGTPALLASARSQQAAGSYARSLETLERALSLAEEAGNRSEIAAVLGASGNAQQALGQRAAAEELLTRGVHLADQEGESALASRIENDLANHYAAAGASARAREMYLEAIAQAERSGDAVGAVKASANAARLALESGAESEARRLLERAERGIAALSSDRTKVNALLHLGRSHAQLAELSSADRRASSLLRAHALLQSAAELSRTFDEPRLRSYALGNLGSLYQSERRFEEGLALTREALRSAELAQAPDALYRWHRQEGQLLWAQGRADPAVRAYRRAVEILESTRQESRAQYGTRSGTFGRAFAPVYLDLADALLRGADAVRDPAAVESLLLEARSTVEKLKAAELRNYLRDDCAAELDARTASLDSLASGAAMVYPIVLRDRLELLVRMQSGLKRYTVPVPAEQIEAKAGELRLLLQDRTSTAYRSVARQLYDWLVRPYAAALDPKQVETLVFVPDGPLRAVPMAALHDGEHFLAERFSVAAAPGLSLVDPRPLDLARVKPLLGGVSEAVQGFAPLGSVPSELASIRESFGGEVLLDDAFRTDRIEAAIEEARPTLVHFASHAVFTGDPSTSFVLTHDGRMSIGELGSVLRRTRFRADPVELLVLSACDTAVGDERAALGLAGIAVRSGARSALGTLWAISDEATYPLIRSFYAKLREPGTSRAAALRHAQRELLASQTYSHPFYWSTFVLISNWL